MASAKKQRAPANVARLDDSNLFVLAPHPDRVQQIKRWHIDQAMGNDDPIVTLNVSINTKQTITITGLGIEPAHAQILLDELDAIRARLANIAAKGRPKQDGSSTVIPFRRTA